MVFSTEIEYTIFNNYVIVNNSLLLHNYIVSQQLRQDVYGSCVWLNNKSAYRERNLVKY